MTSSRNPHGYGDCEARGSLVAAVLPQGGGTPARLGPSLCRTSRGPKSATDACPVWDTGNPGARDDPVGVPSSQMLRELYGQFKRFLRWLNAEGRPVKDTGRAVKQAEAHRRDIESRYGGG